MIGQLGEAAKAPRPFSIRRAEPRDVADLTRLWAALQAFNAEMDPRLRPAQDAANRFAAFLADSLAADHTAAFVAEANDTIIGFVIGQIHERPTLAASECAYISDLYVEPASRLTGAGRALFEALREWYTRKGITVVEVQIVRASASSQAFWRKMGFTDFLRTLRREA